MATPSAGGIQNTLCIPIKKVAAWLFTINPNKVKEAYKAAVIAFQDELQHVLYSYVKGDLTPENFNALLRLVEEMRIELNELRADNAEMRKQFEEFEYGADTIATRYASAGAHAMLAVKARKRHLRIAVN